MSAPEHTSGHLDLDTFEKIVTLLDQGETVAAIREATGAGRQTIRDISEGYIPPCAREAKPRRCPGCGGLVYMPCVLCRVRKIAAKGRNGTSRLRDD